MKNLTVIIGLGCALIVLCMFYLAKTGISLSPAVLIKPSTFTNETVPLKASIQRLFPQFSRNKSWSISPTPKSDPSLILQMKEHIKKKHPDVALTEDPRALDYNEVLMPKETLTIYVEAFKDEGFGISDVCNNMKRLNYKCFVEVSLHKSRRKMKDTSQKYFMLTSYLDSHFLLLIQQN